MHFANDRNYRIEVFKSNYDDGVIGLQTGLYDVMTGYLGDVYSKEVRQIGLYPSDGMFSCHLYFIEKQQRDISVDASILE